jgi:hypothetical protein
VKFPGATYPDISVRLHETSGLPVYRSGRGVARISMLMVELFRSRPCPTCIYMDSTGIFLPAMPEFN